ncbi:hypothetical protein F5I97DRAFT_1828293 [Phlebopus sp. FC_14]|nr:hypothetical protein F5I97DRAFT_1828293 [Phlebopus sp. FC_14]
MASINIFHYSDIELTLHNDNSVEMVLAKTEDTFRQQQEAEEYTQIEAESKKRSCAQCDKTKGRCKREGIKNVKHRWKREEYSNLLKERWKCMHTSEPSPSCLEEVKDKDEMDLENRKLMKIEGMD